MHSAKVAHNDGRTILYSGHEEQHVRGVGIVLNWQATKALMGWKPVSDRIITARFHSPQVKCYRFMLPSRIPGTMTRIPFTINCRTRSMIHPVMMWNCSWATSMHRLTAIVKSQNVWLDLTARRGISDSRYPSIRWSPSSSVALRFPLQILFGNAVIISSQWVSNPTPCPSSNLFRTWFLISVKTEKQKYLWPCGFCCKSCHHFFAVSLSNQLHVLLVVFFGPGSWSVWKAKTPVSEMKRTTALHGTKYCTGFFFTSCWRWMSKHSTVPSDVLLWRVSQSVVVTKRYSMPTSVSYYLFIHSFYLLDEKKYILQFVNARQEQDSKV